MAELTRGQYKQLLATGRADLLTQIMNGETTLEEAGLVKPEVVVAKIVPKPVVKEELKKKDLGSSKRLRGLVRRQ